MSDAGFWRACAAAYEATAGTAESRGSNPLLVAKLRETAVRYRQWAIRAERDAWLWPGGWSPSDPFPAPARPSWRWLPGFRERLPEMPGMLTPAEPAVSLRSDYSEPARGNEESACPTVTESLTSR